MAQDSWPSPGHNDRAVTDSEYEVMAGRFSDDGVYGSPADAAVVAAGAGLTVTIRSGVAASVRGHAWTSGSTGDALTIAANASSSARIDRVVLRLDRSDWTVRAVVRQGTPGSAAPALVRDPGDTGIWEILLAGVTVSPGAGSVTVTRGELYVGTRIRPATANHLNPNPELGEMAWETDTQRVRLWDGSSWRTTYSDSGQLNVDSPLSAWSVQTQSVLQVRDGSAHLRLGSFVRTAGNLSGSVQSRLPVLIPAAYRHPTRDQYVIMYISGLQIGRATLHSAGTDGPGQLWLTQKPDIPTGRSILGSSISWAVS
ncbi:hypothetical protein ACFYNN_12850 [Streptomyces sp. NPDC006978]|uniref:hypothetical protein n=1 Tax=Streptomyces sp. NPDC006978 TaxID=3364769 RepID=UPI0036C8907E